MSNPTATTPAAYETRPATVWDLLAVYHAFVRGGTVESHWHTGPEAGRVATWVAHPVHAHGSSGSEITLVHPSDAAKDSPESLEIDFDYLDTPDKAERHLVHADLRGVTFREIDPTTEGYRLIDRATYRLTDDPPRLKFHPEFTGAELYAQHERTFAALAEAMTTHGFPATVFDVDMGSYVCLMTANGAAETGYHLVAAWASGADVPKHWVLVPTYKDHEYDTYDTNEWKFEYHDLGLPLDAPVKAVAAAAADWLAANAPDLRAA